MYCIIIQIYKHLSIYLLYLYVSVYLSLYIYTYIRKQSPTCKFQFGIVFIEINNLLGFFHPQHLILCIITSDKFLASSGENSLQIGVTLEFRWYIQISKIETCITLKALSSLSLKMGNKCIIVGMNVLIQIFYYQMLVISWFNPFGERVLSFRIQIVSLCYYKILKLALFQMLQFFV